MAQSTQYVSHDLLNVCMILNSSVRHRVSDVTSHETRTVSHDENRALDFLYMNYQPPHALEVLFPSSTLSKYHRLFIFNLRLLRGNIRFSLMWCSLTFSHSGKRRESNVPHVFAGINPSLPNLRAVAEIIRALPLHDQLVRHFAVVLHL